MRDALLGPAPDFNGLADSIYFLMFDSWEQEMRSNRWHYATRWAKNLPVVLVLPSLVSDFDKAVSRDEPRIPNVRILRTRANAIPQASLRSCVVQAHQILADMKEHGFSRPILWTYNPNYALASAIIPSPLRVFHATENYFNFEQVSAGFLERLRTTLKLSDLVLAVSDGVAKSYRRECDDEVVEVVTNGCDYAFYAKGGTDEKLVDEKRNYEKLVVYAGNVNERIDFDLLADCAEKFHKYLFAIFGPLSPSLSEKDTATWRRILRMSNVRYFGPTPVDRLPFIFTSADLGIVPYKTTRLMVENAFPLKVFEMLATGLPVAATMLKPMVPEQSEAFRIAADRSQFIDVVKILSRDTLSADVKDRIRQQAQSHDYDLKFAIVTRKVRQLLARNSAPRSLLTGLFGLTGTEGATEVAEQLTFELKRSPLTLKDYFEEALSAAGFFTVAVKIRSMLPAPVWRAIRNTVLGEPRVIPFDSGGGHLNVTSSASRDGIGVEHEHEMARAVAKKLNILLLCDDQDAIAATVRDHLRALERYSYHQWWTLSMLGDLPTLIDLDRFDAVVIHYTLVASSEFYLSSSARQRLAQFNGLKLIFIQDEYRFVDRSTAAMREIGVDVLFTCAPPDVTTKVYPPEKLPGVTVKNVLTGYVPDKLLSRSVPPPGQRSIDIGYRGRNLPAWLGELGQEKMRIGVRMLEEGRAHGLRVDISFREEDRLYGEDWINFVSSCKAMLGVESGASVVDFTGEIQQKVELHAASKPTTTFEEMRDLYFAEEEGKISFAQISPRCFESAALRTLMILYEGRYSDILVPWRHYVPLKKDHSNLDEVVAILRNPEKIEQITSQAYNEIACNSAYSFKRAVEDVDRVVEQTITERHLARKPAYTEAEFAKVKTSAATRWRQFRRAVMTKLIHFVMRGLLGRLDPVRRTHVHAMLRKIYNTITFYRWRRRGRLQRLRNLMPFRRAT